MFSGKTEKLIRKPKRAKIANRKAFVTAAELDMDYLGEAFSPIPELMAIAEYTTNIHVICVTCGNLAQLSNRISKENSLVHLDETESYQYPCRNFLITQKKNE